MKMTKAELTSVIEKLIKENLETLFKPTVQKIVLEELSLILKPAIKKIIKEEIGDLAMVKESQIPVSDYRKNLMEKLGLSHGRPSLLGLDEEQPRQQQRRQPQQTGGLSGILAETLQEMQPGELDSLGAGEMYGSTIDPFGSGNTMDFGGLSAIPNIANSVAPPDYMQEELPQLQGNDPLAKLNAAMNKDYSGFMNEINEHSNNTRTGIAMQVETQQNAIRSRLKPPAESKKE